jgi:hypothetical protein
MQIVIEKNAYEYILQKTGAVLISLQFEPALGGCACSPTRLSGTYIPMITLGKPSADDADQYQSQFVDQVQVYSPPILRLKHGQTELRIKLRGLHGFRWLEIDGAQGIPCLIGQ